MAEDQQEILDQLREVKAMTERQQEMTEQQQHSIDALVKITQEQSAMIDKMWRQVSPILQKENKKEELKQQLLLKIMSGGVWAMIAGVFLAAWQGFKIFIKGE